MAFVVKDRVRETTTTTGTGTVTLAGAAFGFQSFSAIGDGNITYYVISNQSATEWEVGVGTYTAAGTTLARTTVISSSNAGALVNFTAGTKDVFVSPPASRTVLGSPGMMENSQTIAADYTLTTGTNALSAGPITINTGITVTVPTGAVWSIV
jgi:hypothetical protein